MPEIAATKNVMVGLVAAIALIVIIGVAGAFTVGSDSKDSKDTTRTTLKASSPTATKNAVVKDPCVLVTATEASTAFGSDSGPAHLLLGACLYDNGPKKLIVALTRDNAKSQFDNERGTAKAVAGIGDQSYVRDGRLRVLKDRTLMMITLVPSDPTGASPALLTLGKMAATRL